MNGPNPNLEMPPHTAHLIDQKVGMCVGGKRNEALDGTENLQIRSLMTRFAVAPPEHYSSIGIAPPEYRY